MGTESHRKLVEDRAFIIQLYQEVKAEKVTMKTFCELVGIPERTLRRWLKDPTDKRKGAVKSPPNKLTPEEESRALEVINSKEFADLSPRQIVPKLADRGIYLASESTIYRIMKRHNLVNSRRSYKPQFHQKPKSLVAKKSNQIWSWDITYLKLIQKGRYCYLYLVMDIFSRKIIYWEIHERECSHLAANMIEKACSSEQIKSHQVTLHSDNGGPMKGATMLATLQKLGVATSFSRPGVSDDNPYSESTYSTLKGMPNYPKRGFKTVQDAQEWVERFTQWYNNCHLHSGIRYVTPMQRHEGQDKKILENRKKVYEYARKANPIRWAHHTRNWDYINEVFLNPENSCNNFKSTYDTQKTS